MRQRSSEPGRGQGPKRQRDNETTGCLIVSVVSEEHGVQSCASLWGGCSSSPLCEATGLSSKHRAEFGTLEHSRSLSSHSERLLELSKLSESHQSFQSSKKTSQHSELLRVGGAQKLRVTQSHSEHSELLRAIPETPSYYSASSEPAVSGIASSSEPRQ